MSPSSRTQGDLFLWKLENLVVLVPGQMLALVGVLGVVLLQSRSVVRLVLSSSGLILTLLALISSETFANCAIRKYRCVFAEFGCWRCFVLYDVHVVEFWKFVSSYNGVDCAFELRVKVRSGRECFNIEN